MPRTRSYFAAEIRLARREIVDILARPSRLFPATDAVALTIHRDRIQSCLRRAKKVKRA